MAPAKLLSLRDWLHVVRVTEPARIAVEEAAMLSASFAPVPADFRVPSNDPENAKSVKNPNKHGGVARFRHPISAPISNIGIRKTGTGISPAPQSTQQAQGKPIEPDVSSWLPEFIACSVGENQDQWLIENFIPRIGTSLHHGPPSVGKSPYQWAMAVAVAVGGIFFGHRVVETGPVLCIELDTPSLLVHPRLAKLRVVPEQMYLEVFSRTIDILNLKDEDRTRLERARDTVQPVLVIVNTLRKSMTADTKDDAIPSQVYGAWQALFPGAHIAIFHHDKKDVVVRGAKANSDQMFSGSQAWQNDAAVAFHLTRDGKPSAKKSSDDGKGTYEKSRVRIKMTKSQVCDHEAWGPLILQLEPDGTNWVQTGPDAYRTAYLALPKDMKKADKIKALEQQFDIGKTVLYEALKPLKKAV